jgi:hypothetical protein
MTSYRRSLSPYRDRNGSWEDGSDLALGRSDFDDTGCPHTGYYEEIDSVRPSYGEYQSYLEDDQREYLEHRDDSPDLIDHDNNYGYYEVSYI